MRRSRANRRSSIVQLEAVLTILGTSKIKKEEMKPIKKRPVSQTQQSCNTEDQSLTLKMQ